MRDARSAEAALRGTPLRLRPIGIVRSRLRVFDLEPVLVRLGD